MWEARPIQVIAVVHGARDLAVLFFGARELIWMLLSVYENDSWKDAKIEWPEDKAENAVEAFATKRDRTTLALKHTLIEPFVSEKYDTTILL